MEAEEDDDELVDDDDDDEGEPEDDEDDALALVSEAFASDDLASDFPDADAPAAGELLDDEPRLSLR